MDFLTYNEIRKGKAAVDVAIAGVENLIPNQTGKADLALKTDGVNTFWGSVAPLPTETAQTIGCIISTSARGNLYPLAWTSSAAWTTYYNDLSNANSITQAWNMALGDGYPNGSTQTMYSGDSGADQHRELLFSNGNRLGIEKWQGLNTQVNNTGDYSGVSWMIIPVRNTTDSSITVTFYRTYSGAGSNYGGAGFAVYTPNSSTYTATTGGSWNNLWTYTSETYGGSASISVTIPASTTVIIMATSGDYYHTSYSYINDNKLYNLSTTFNGTNGLVCDLRMLYTLFMGRVIGDTYTSSNPYKFYNLCAELYGNR